MDSPDGSFHRKISSKPERKDLTEAEKGAIMPLVVVVSRQYGPLAQLVRASGS